MPELHLQRSGEFLVASIDEHKSTVAWWDIAPTSATTERIQREPAIYGHELFTKVFNNELQQILSHVRRDERLLLVADDPTVTAIAWEYLRDQNGLLAVHHPLVRGIPQQERRDVRMLDSAVEIVAIPVSPIDNVHELNVEQEYQNLLTAVVDTGKALMLTRVRPPTMSRVEQALNPDVATIVHFMGHSDSADGESWLMFEDDYGRTRHINAAEFAGAIAGDVLLVVLNSCFSATGGEQTEFGNIAWGLVRQGIPYALGMQFTIPDDAALELSKTLFNFLFRGRSIEDAMRRTRRGLLESVLPDKEWIAGIPVLYTNQREQSKPLRLSDGPTAIRPDPDRLQKLYDISILPEAAHFLGRTEEISHVLSALLGSDNLNFVMLHGLGGVGKTALARAVAVRVGWHYGDRGLAYSFETFAAYSDDGAIMINQQFADTFYTRLALFYGIDTNSPRFQQRENEQPVPLLQEILQQREYNRSLLILDNIETLLDALERNIPEAQALAAFVKRLGEGQGDVILTSRTRLPPDWGRSDIVSVGGLDQTAGAKLFLALLGVDRKVSAPQTERLALTQRVDGHPLSIRLLAARFNEVSTDLAAFLQDIDQELKVAEQDTPDSLTDHERQRTLYACLTYSIRRLTEPQKKALRAMALFQGYFTYKLASMVLDDQVQGQVHLRTLERLGLLNSDTKTVEDGTIVQLEMHPMVRWYVIHHIQPDLMVQRRYGQACWGLANRSRGEFNRNAQLRAQIIGVLADFENILQSAPGQFLDADEMSDLAYSLGVIYFQRGQPRRSRELFEQALEYYELQDQKSSTALVQQALAGVLFQQGFPEEAMDLYHQALTTFKQLGHQEQIAVTQNRIALALLSQGQPQAALELHSQALATFEKLGDRFQIALMKGSIAGDWIQLGKPKTAMPLYQEALPVLLEFKDQYSVAQAQSGIATVLRQLSDSEQSLEMYQEALHTFENLGDKSQAASTRFAIAEVLLQLGRYEEAKQLYTTVMQAQQELKDQYALLVTRSGMAETLQRQGLHADAFEMFVEITQDALKLHEMRTATLAQKGMADAMALQGEFEQALPLYAAALQTATELGDRREVAIIQFQYCQTLLQMGQPKAGLTMMWESYRTLRDLGFDKDAQDIEEFFISVKKDGLGIASFDQIWVQTIAEPQPEWLQQVQVVDMESPAEELAIRTLVNTRTWDEAAELIKDRQAIYFMPQIERVLDLQIQRANHENRVAYAEMLSSHLNFLRSAKQSKRMEVSRAFVNAKSWEALRTLLGQYHELLLEPEVETIFQRSIEDAREQGDQNAISRLEQRLNMLHDVRNLGIDKTFLFLELGFTSHKQMEAAEQAITQFLSTADWEAARRILEAEQILMYSATVNLLSVLIEESVNQKEQETVALLQTHLDVLESAVRRGIDWTFANIKEAVEFQRKLRDAKQHIVSIAATADKERFDRMSQTITIDESLTLLKDLMHRANSKEIIVGGVALLRQLGGERSEKTLKELLDRTGNRRSQELYLDALRALSDPSAQWANQWTKQNRPIDPLKINIGEGLVPLFDQERGGAMLNQIQQLREELMEEQQFMLPPIRIEDDLWLEENSYELLIRGEPVCLETVAERQTDPSILAKRLKQIFLQHWTRIISSSV